MSYCRNCGAQLDENTNFCSSCGARQSVIDQTTVKEVNDLSDNGSAGWGVLGFFFPLVGLILYLIWRDNKPKNAKSAGKGALIGVIVSVVLSIISTILYVIFLPQILEWIQEYVNEFDETSTDAIIGMIHALL